MPAPLSIIIPTLNEEAGLPACFAHLMAGVDRGLIREVVIVDGGSSDLTREIGEATGARVLTSACGRGAQLIAGAQAARGDWFLFLHADTHLSPDWATRALAHMEERPGNAAAFTLTYRSDARGARILAKRANWRTRVLGLPYGDQGLLISRPLYNRVGGYESIPLMEDIAIIRAIGKDRLTLLRAEARTSPVKYERDGWRRRSWRNAWLVARYFAGAPPEQLAIEYYSQRPKLGRRPTRPAIKADQT